MLMLAVMVSFLALLVGLAAMWMAGGASKKAEVQHHTFYESHIKGIKQSLSELSKVVGGLGGQVAKLQQQPAGSEDQEDLERRLKSVEEKLTSLASSLKVVQKD